MNCKNCNKPLLDIQKYCDECGAKVIQNRLTLKVLFQQINAEVMSIDNKLFLTFIHLFTKPEAVIISFIEGTRKKYINVIQYFAIGLRLLGVQVFFMSKIFNNPELYQLQFLESFANSPGQENNPFLNGNINDSDDYNSLQSLIFTISIPISAFTTWLAFRVNGFRRFNFTEHVVINLYYGAQTVIVSAFIYITFLAFGIHFFTTATLIFILTYIYFFYVLKRVFRTSFWSTLGSFLLSLIFISILVFVLMILLSLMIVIYTKLIR